MIVRVPWWCSLPVWGACTTAKGGGVLPGREADVATVGCCGMQDLLGIKASVLVAGLCGEYPPGAVATPLAPRDESFAGLRC